MNINKIQTPVGLENAVAAVQKIVAHPQPYQRCGHVPPHFIINLDAGNGQTTLTEYIAESYADHHIRHFGGLDMFLEYTLDGSMEQLKKVFANIRACAVYTNNFEGVVAMDISRLAERINEDQMNVFIRELAEISSSATMVLYIPSAMNRNLVNLVAKVHEVLDNVELIRVAPYTPQEFAAIIKRMIADSGAIIEDSMECDEFLLNIVSEKHISSIKAAKELSRAMMKYADFSDFLPRLNLNELKRSFPAAEQYKMEVK